MDEDDLEKNFEKVRVDENLSPKKIDRLKADQGIHKKKDKRAKACSMHTRSSLKNKSR